MIKYSIIIPVFDNKAGLLSCLKALKKQINKQTEIIVIDDNSSQKGIEKVAKKFTRKFIKLKKNSGAGLARNSGVKLAKGKYLIFIDSDVVISDKFFKKILRKIQKLSPDSCLQGVYGEKTPIKSLCSQYKNLYYFYNFFHRISKDNFFYLSSHCFVIPKRIFEKVGGFNSQIRTVIEDADLSYRLLRKGYRVILDRELVVSHLKRFSWLNLLLNDARLSFTKAKHILRNIFKNDKEKLIIISGGKLNEMYPIILSVLVAPLLLVGFLAFFFLREKIIFCFLIPLFFIFMLLNLVFFRFIRDKKGMAFLLKIIPLFYLDMLFAFFGVTLGFFDYLILGKRY